MALTFVFPEEPTQRDLESYLTLIISLLYTYICSAMVGVPHRPLLPSLPTGCGVDESEGEDGDDRPAHVVLEDGKSQSPHKSVNLFFVIVIITDKLTDLCGN